MLEKPGGRRGGNFSDEQVPQRSGRNLKGESSGRAPNPPQVSPERISHLQRFRLISQEEQNDGWKLLSCHPSAPIHAFTTAPSPRISGVPDVFLNPARETDYRGKIGS